MIRKTDVVVLSAETARRIYDPNALAIWCYLSAYPERNSIASGMVPFLMKEHFELTDKRFVKAWRLLVEFGLVDVVGDDVRVLPTITVQPVVDA